MRRTAASQRDLMSPLDTTRRDRGLMTMLQQLMESGLTDARGMMAATSWLPFEGDPTNPSDIKRWSERNAQMEGVRGQLRDSAGGFLTEGNLQRAINAEKNAWSDALLGRLMGGEYDLGEEGMQRYQQAQREFSKRRGDDRFGAMKPMGNQEMARRALDDQRALAMAAGEAPWDTSPTRMAVPISWHTLAQRMGQSMGSPWLSARRW